ncbi:MAG: hypothetical protein J0L99_08250 [Chitinophagales bacterium]|nr:hypothetical protein [Chitinophagales bacterium]
MLLPTNIQDVIFQLRAIVADCTQRGDMLGYFPQLYLRVTELVAQGIENKQFEDNERMERLDVIFANRYLQAYADFKAGGGVTQSWRAAFEAAQNGNLLILQHLMLGMNAHISLDLCIAAASVSTPQTMDSLEVDFKRINSILLGEIDQVQQHLSRVSPLLGLLDTLTQKRDEQFAGFSMVVARDIAWANTVSLAAHPDQKQYISGLDEKVAGMSQRILNPGRFIGILVVFARWFERGNVQENLRHLAINS